VSFRERCARDAALAAAVVVPDSGRAGHTLVTEPAEEVGKAFAGLPSSERAAGAPARSQPEAYAHAVYGKPAALVHAALAKMRLRQDNGVISGKITAMLLERDHAELLLLLDSPGRLQARHGPGSHFRTTISPPACSSWAVSRGV
jgi:hypothetical protein